MQQTKKIIVTAIVVMAVIGGVVYFWQQKNNLAQNALTPLDPEQKLTTREQPAQNIRTSEELMKELIIKKYPSDIVENYKIFEEIKSPNSKRSAVLFGPDYYKTQECCVKPTGIFINNQGKLEDKYDILQGALQHMYLDNMKWQDNNTVQYDFVISDEGGKQITQKSIVVD